VFKSVMAAPVDPAASFFRLLTAGVSFDRKRFSGDAKRFGLAPASLGLKDETELRLSSPLPPIPVAGEEECAVGAKDKKRHQEKINHFRKVNRIHVSGTDISNPIESWKQLSSLASGFSETLLSNLSGRYATPTPIQMQAIPLMMDRREIIACAPTGSGKTAAYLVPLIHHLMSTKLKAGGTKKRIRSLILCPTRELAQQVLRECQALVPGGSLKVAAFDKTDEASVGKLNGGGTDILITVPNRMVYLLQEDKVKLNKIEWLVVDESDKLFEVGERGFRDQLATIYRACSSGKARRALFSATFATDVEDWCKTNLDNVVTVTVGERNTATKAVKQELLYTGSEKGKLVACRQLVSRGEMVPPVLVFVQTKERAKELQTELTKGGKNELHVDAIHSEKSELQRDRTVRAFRSGQVWVLICTELLGRGIDFKGVNLVVNYDFPPSTVSYIHRIGRTGRAGRPGRAVTFFTDQDKVLLRSIAHIVKGSGGVVPDYMLKLKKASRQEKRKLAKSAVKRQPISTESLYDKEKREKLDAMIKGSKNRKRKAEQRSVDRKLKAAKKPKLEEGSDQPVAKVKRKKKKLDSLQQQDVTKQKKRKKIKKKISSED